MKNAIILAAGKGTRMQSQKTKVMHEILKKPMIEMLVDNLQSISVDEIVVVAGHHKEQIMDYMGDRVDYAVQDEQKGTGDAVAQVTQLKGKQGSTLIVLGDCALIQPETLEMIYEKHASYDLTLITAKMQEPGSYRRIIRDNQGAIERVVDYRNLEDTEKDINEISVGVYCVNNELLFDYIKDIQGDVSTVEFNISKLVEIMKKNGHSIQSVRVDDAQEFLGVNDRTQLHKASKWLQARINSYWLREGVTLIDSDSTYIGVDVIIDKDVTIYPNNHIYGKSKIGSGSVIMPNSWLENAHIGENVTVDASRIVDSEVGNQTTVGPYAHLRMHTAIGEKARVGNFVEFKNVKFSDKAKSAHLTYLGDAEVGVNTNIGCGVVTANYDGKTKFRTKIGDGVFVGSNTTLVAPVVVGDRALLAAGSTISDDVEEGAMGIARARQVVKPGYGEKFLSKKEDK